MTTSTSINPNIGEVYKMKLTKKEGVKDKNKGDDGRHKYFIIVGIENDIAIGIVLINSDINEKLPQKLKELHYPLKASKYNFLKHNSFACCGNLKEVKIERFKNLLEQPKGKIDDDDLILIIGAVIESPYISPKILKRFELIK